MVNHTCVACNGTNEAGDDPARGDTSCYAPGTCGGVQCHDEGTVECNNFACKCKEGWQGRRWELKEAEKAQRVSDARSLIRTIVEGEEKDKEIERFLKSVQDMQESLVAQKAKEKKEAAIEAAAQAVAQGKTQEEANVDIAKATKAAIDEEKQPISKDELPQKTKAIVESLQVIASTEEAVIIEPVIAVAPPNNEEEDTCDQGFGPGCPIMAIADEAEVVDGKQELTILETAAEKDSWAVMAQNPDAPELLTKQTRLEAGAKKYKMECWDGEEWGNPTTFDIGADGASTYFCKLNVVLVGSMAGLCNQNTCKNGGTCSASGASFTCVCPAGFTGPLCEEVVLTTHCSDFDCSNAGGHRTFATYADGQCGALCSETVCCLSTKAAFSTACSAITDAKLYVETGCCDKC